LDIGEHRELKVLEAITEDERMTQRGLATRLGIALGLTNLYLKRLVRKGYIKCVNVQSNRVLYLITPKGIAEKTRLTYEFLDYSLKVYREGRRHLKTMLEPYAQQASARIAIYGTGEAAELAYLCLKELGLEPVAVFADAPGPAFFGTPVEPIAACAKQPFDAVIVAMLENPADVLLRLERLGIARDKLVPLREPAGAPAESAANRADAPRKRSL
jgi:DNA-binding MarR family transcriptional regulator